MMTVSTARAWEEVRLGVEFGLGLANAYVEQSVTFRFEHEDGTVIERPGFWEGGAEVWVRFCVAEGWGDLALSREKQPGGWGDRFGKGGGTDCGGGYGNDRGAVRGGGILVPL